MQSFIHTILNKLSQKTGVSGIPLAMLLGTAGFFIIALAVVLGGIGLQAYQNLLGETPLRLGLYPDRSQEQILELVIEAPYTYNIDLTESGRYAILTEYEVQFDETTATLIDIQSGQSIEVAFSAGWFDPANEDRIPPHPLFSFTIDHPGQYELSFSDRPSLAGTRLLIVLDHSIGNVNIYWLTIAFQTAVLLSPVALFLRRIRRRRRETLRASTQTKRDDFGDFIKDELSRDKHS